MCGHTYAIHVHTWQEGDVVCFVSRISDDQGVHSAVMLESAHRGTFPPLTLYGPGRVL